MTLSQREHPEAVAEFDAAVRWYEEQEPEIGLALIDQARQARKDLDQWPNAAPPFTIAADGTVIRSKAIRGYPYRIVYTVEPDTILILACVHERREPGYWLHPEQHGGIAETRAWASAASHRYTGTSQTRTIFLSPCVSSDRSPACGPWMPARGWRPGSRRARCGTDCGLRPRRRSGGLRCARFSAGPQCSRHIYR